MLSVPVERVKPSNPPRPPPPPSGELQHDGPPWDLATVLSSAPFGTKCYHYHLEGAPCNVKRLPGKGQQITNTAIMGREGRPPDLPRLPPGLRSASGRVPRGEGGKV